MSESELLERLRAKRALPLADERRQIRLDAGASLRDVAREIGVSPTSVIRWERGSSPGIHTSAYARLLDELRHLKSEGSAVNDAA